MKKYIGSKIVAARPMSRQEYNEYRGFTLPDNEDGTDEGYLVEYLDGGKPNHSDHTGYISWSPKQQFDNGYHVIPDISGSAPHEVRMCAEYAQLEDRKNKLLQFMETDTFKVLDDDKQMLMRRQAIAMAEYASVLLERIIGS